MTIDQLLDLTPEELSIKIESKNQRQDDQLRNDWIRTRHMYSLLFNINVDKKHRKDPEELMPLRWDEEKKKNSGKVISDEERKRIFEAMDRKYLQDFENGKAK